MPLKSWIDARSPSNSSFQSFCSEGADAAGLRQEIGQTYLITNFRTNLQMDDGDAGFHCQFRWSQLRGSKRHRGLWGRRRRWSLKVRVLCRYNWESHHSGWKRKCPEIRDKAKVLKRKSEPRNKSENVSKGKLGMVQGGGWLKYIHEILLIPSEGLSKGLLFERILYQSIISLLLSMSILVMSCLLITLIKMFQRLNDKVTLRTVPRLHSVFQPSRGRLLD